MTAVEYLFNELWDTPKDKLTWHTILNKAKEMEAKQQQKMVDDAITNYELGWADKKASSQKEISDEEIEKAVNNPINDAYCFREGAKWYREQLKQKQ